MVRKGRSYTEIQFYIEDREKPTKKTPDYLEEKSDRYKEQYEKHLNERVKKLEILPLALTNNYVAHLIRHDLIDLQDTDKIIEVYEILVPLYSRMDQLNKAMFLNRWITSKNTLNM